MLNHFKHKSKRSFNFNENRLLNLSLSNSADETEVIGQLDPDEKNERINESFIGFEEKRNEISQLTITKDTHRSRNMYEQLRELFKDEGDIDNTTARQLAAEFTDALSDNEDFVRFSTDGILNPHRIFESTSISEGNLVLNIIGGGTFSVSIDELKSHRYLELERERDQAIQESLTRIAADIDIQALELIAESDPQTEADTASDAIPTAPEAIDPQPNQIRFIIEQIILAQTNTLTGEAIQFRNQLDSISTSTGSNYYDILLNNEELFRTGFDLAATIAGQSQEEIQENLDTEIAERSVEMTRRFAEPISREEAIQADSEFLRAQLPAQILDNYHNADSFNRYELPEEFQNEGYNENRFRLLLTSGRITNSYQIYRNMEALNLSTADLARALDYRNVTRMGNGTNLKRIDLIRNTPYRDENMEEFLGRIVELQQNLDDEQNYQEYLEYLERISVYRAMNSLVTLLENLELNNNFDEIDINPDNIQDVDISEEVMTALRNHGLDRRLIGSEDMLLTAIYIHLFGPLDTFLSKDGIEIEQRGDFNVRRENQYRILINSITDGEAAILANAFNSYSDITEISVGGGRNYRSLTEAFGTIRDSRHYEAIRDLSNATRASMLSEESNDSERIMVLMHRIFDITYTGPYFRNGRRSITMFDVLGDGQRGEHETDEVDARLGELAMFHYLLNSITDFSDGPANLSYERLEAKLNELIAQGKAAARMQAYRMQIDNPEQYEALIAADNVSVDSLRNGQINEAQIEAIRQGILFQASLVETQNDIQNIIEVEPEAGDFIFEIANHFAEAGIPRQDLNRFTQSAWQTIIGADFTDHYNRLNTQDDNPEGAGQFNLNFYTYRDENGELQLAHGEPNENGDVDTYFAMRPGAGNILTPSNIMLDPSEVYEIATFNAEFGINNIGRQDRGDLSANGGINPLVYNASLSFGWDIGRRRRWRAEITPGMVGAFRVANVYYTEFGVERTMGGRIERQINKSIEGTAFDFFEQDEIEAMARGELTSEQMLAIANRSEYIQETIAALQEAGLDAELIDDELDQIRINLVQTLVNAIVNEGLEKLSHISFKGISLTVAIADKPPFVPIIIPSISLSILGENTTYYSYEHSTADVESFSEAQILEILDISNPGPETRNYVIFPSGSVDIVPDRDGNMTMNRVANAVALDQNTGQPITNIEDFADIHQKQMLIEGLNNRRNITGLTFGELNLGPDHPQYDQFNIAFSIGDLDNAGLYGEFEILASRYSGITIEPIEGEHNLFGIRFGNSPDDLPDEPVIMARQDITSPYGIQPTRTVISFNTGTYSEASEIRQNPFLEEILYVDSRGNASFRPNMYYMDIEGIPEFTIDNVREPVDSTELLRSIDPSEYAASQALLDTLTLEGLPETRYTTPSFTPEEMRILNQALEDRSLLQAIREVTSYNVNLGNGELLSLPDYNELARIITDRYPQLYNDASITYLISRLIPGTLLRINEVARERRIEQVNNTTELTTQIVEAMARELGMENPEGIARTIRDLNFINDLSDQEIIDALTSDDIALIEPFPGSDEDIAREITANNTWTAVGSSGIIGLRQTIFDFEAEQALPADERSPQIINSSLRRLNLNDPAHMAVAEFFYRLYEPNSTIEQSRVDDIFASAESNGNYEQLAQNETIQQILTSNAALQLLSLNMSSIETDGGDTQVLSLVSYYLNEEGNPDNTVFLNELYTYVREINAGREAQPPTMNAERARVLQEFTNWIVQILNAPVSSSQLTITEPDTGRELFTINLNSEAGTFLIRECANLSFYFDREISANLEFQMPQGFGTGAAASNVITPGGRPVTRRSEGELGLAAAFNLVPEGLKERDARGNSTRIGNGTANTSTNNGASVGQGYRN